jgi:glycosyltransferase involved in cell wall biosynthesis
MDPRFFDTAIVAEAAGRPLNRADLIHWYLEDGRDNSVIPVGWFDAAFYLRNYADVREGAPDPYLHFLLHGRYEGRFPNAEMLHREARILTGRNGMPLDFYGRELVRSGHQVPTRPLVEHYLLKGHLDRVVPDPRFDRSFFETLYPDYVEHTINPYTYYVLNREYPWVYPNEAAAAGDLAVIAGSQHFDAEWYRNRYEIGDRIGPELHYLANGFRRGNAASPAFDSSYYLEKYRDIRQAQLNPLWHYQTSGAAEGRASSGAVDCHLLQGGRPLEFGCPTILVGIHDAGRTGAPILGLNLIKRFADRANIVVWIGREGALRDEFLANSCFTLIGYQAPPEMRVAVDKLLQQVPIDLAYLCSVECEPLLDPLSFREVPIVSLINEFSEYTFPREKLPRLVAHAQVVVVPADVVRDSAVDALSTWSTTAPTNIVVRPQGRSVVPRDATAPTQVEITAEWLRRRVRGRSHGDVLIILGAGYVQPRKGVDLFVEVARRLVFDLGVDCRFIWVGANYRPTDLSFGTWVADQVKRSGLKDKVFFFEEQDTLAPFWETCDAFLLTSRLDPMPNVVLDAMAEGKPVVCFEKATGAAELAGRFPRLVKAAPYMDTGAAAAALKDLIAAGAQAASEGEERRDLDALLDLRSYAEDLWSFGQKAIEKIQACRVETFALAESRAFEPLFSAGNWREPGFGQSRHPLRLTTSLHSACADYVLLASNGVFVAKPKPGFNDGVLAAAGPSSLDHPETALPLLGKGASEPDPTTHTIYRVYPESGTVPEAVELAAVFHIHMHYADLAPMFVSALTRAGAQGDVVMTTDSPQKRTAVEQAFRDYDGGRVEVRIVPNVGRDVGPFLELGKSGYFDAYDLVCHLHGKKSAGLGSDLPEKWLAFLLGHLLGTKSVLGQIRSLFARQERLGLLFPDDPSVLGWSANLPYAAELAAELGIADQLPAFPEFPVGNMFWARPAAIRPMFALHRGWSEYPPEPVGYDGTMLHAMERLWPTVCESTGYTWATVHVPGSYR